MGTVTPESLVVDTGAGEIGVVRWSGPPGAPFVFAVHGITANAWSWATVARHLDGSLGLVAIDLRGRGSSHAVPGPFGIRRHADDVVAVLRCLNASPAVVAGHSMGAFVALAAAERHPDDVTEVVLVDGGVPIPAPTADDTDTDLDELLGPAVDRLRRIWPDRVSYRAMWNEHPAFGDLTSPDVERYVLSDLIECEGGFRSVVSEEAVRLDGAELLADEALRGMLARRSSATTILRAETGVNDAPPPLIDDRTVATSPGHRWRTVAGTNHYSILLGDAGAAAVAEELSNAVR
jgi:pimeloyl-ACP methyl ester carboxylesterase